MRSQAGNSAVERAFRDVGLPQKLVDERHHRIPMQSMVSLFDAAAHRSGDPLFGLRVGLEMPLNSYGLWTDYSASADTLGQVLKRIVATIGIHQTAGWMDIKRIASHVIWTYHNGTQQSVSGLHHADHVLPVMVEFVRTYLGADWLPSWTEMSYLDDGKSQERADLFGVDWKFGGPGIRFPIPAKLMGTRRRDDARPRTLCSVDLVANARLRSAPDLGDEIAAIVSMRLLNGYSDLEGVAAMTDCGTRTLQRHLDQEGTSYRKILDWVRHKKAMKLIAETSLANTEIAITLGYSDPANFTRAFRRWTGASPSVLRRSVETVAETDFE